MIIREYTKNDIPRMTEIWCSAFHEDESSPRLFFRKLPEIGSAVVLDDNGVIMAMASVITGLELRCTDIGDDLNVGYIYAVAVDETFRGRGYGADISKAAYDLALKLGSTIVCTLPSNEPLYEFYEKSLGFETALFRKACEVKAENLEMTMKLESDEYLEMRNILLEGQTYLKADGKVMDYEAALCELYDGGLFATSSGICIAQSVEDSCIIYEILSDDPERTAASVADALGCKTARYFVPSDEDSGEKYLMAEKGKIPKECIWNITFD